MASLGAVRHPSSLVKVLRGFTVNIRPLLPMSGQSKAEADSDYYWHLLTIYWVPGPLLKSLLV